MTLSMPYSTGPCRHRESCPSRPSTSRIRRTSAPWRSRCVEVAPSPPPAGRERPVSRSSTRPSSKRWWPGKGGWAVGHAIQLGGPAVDGPRCEIVGVAGNVSELGLDAKPLPEIFPPFAPREPAARVVMIRTAGDPKPLVPAVRRRVALLDRGLAIESLRPLTQSLAATLARRRFGTLLLTLFAGLAMTLAGVGIYGLLSYWVSAREKSIAIRVALGAPRGAIFRWVAGQALALAAPGTALGAAASWAVSRWAESPVFGAAVLRNHPSAPEAREHACEAPSVGELHDDLGVESKAARV
jgi:hypothetical protein